MHDRDEDKPKKPGRRKVRIDLRRNRAKLTRDKSELTRQVRADDDAAHDLQREERVRGKGALSRKRTIMVGDDPQVAGAQVSGIVLAVQGLVAEVDDGARHWACVVRRLLRTRLIESRMPITVGDRVRLRPVAAGQGHGLQLSGGKLLPEGVIEKVEPRRTTLMRRYERRVHIIAANVDQAVIVVAARDPTLRPHLIDRYLVAVHQGGMRPILCINKADLDDDGSAMEVGARYRALGYQTLLTSVPRGQGIDELRAVLAGATSAVVGISGVGKSSLLNAIEPGFALKIGTMTDMARGKHTTTTARLLSWSFGGHVVDTPGVRQFDFADVGKEELEAYFIEFRDLIARCRFPNCSHTHEASCAIREAVDAGTITQERYDSYCKMYEEAAARPSY